MLKTPLNIVSHLAQTTGETINIDYNIVVLSVKLLKLFGYNVKFTETN